MAEHSLNSNQQAAVESDAPSLLIVAGPGAGKTHTLTCRILHQINTLNSSQKILAITFTRKAAGEMRSRLSAPPKIRRTDGRIDSPDEQLFVGTFHQWCADVLRQYAGRDFSVAGDDQCLPLARELWPGLKMSDYKKRLEQISLYKSCRFQEEEPDDVQSYNQILRARGWYDFDDLMLETLRLFQNNPDVLSAVKRVYPKIFVDEYQDINAIQHELLKILTGPENHLTAIGDPDQAVYGFRGSDVRFFHAFDKIFSGAQILYLNENYRNAKDVLAAASQMMAPGRGKEVPAQAARLYEQGLLTIHASATDRSEAEYIVHTVEQLIGGTSMFSQDSGRVAAEQEGELSFGDIAVLYRLKSQAVELKKAFERSGMPFHVVGDADAQQEIEDDLFSQRHAEPDVDSEKITLMTLHASKGLEFGCVFICGCEDGLIPLSLMKMCADREEERRLLYVGMTRAKHRLYLTHTSRRRLYGRRLSTPPSPFLKDIEESLKNHSRTALNKKKKESKDDGQMTFF